VGVEEKDDAQGANTGKSGCYICVADVTYYCQFENAHSIRSSSSMLSPRHFAPSNEDRVVSSSSSPWIVVVVVPIPDDGNAPGQRGSETGVDEQQDKELKGETCLSRLMLHMVVAAATRSLADHDRRRKEVVPSSNRSYMFHIRYPRLSSAFPSFSTPLTAPHSFRWNPKGRAGHETR